jgi:hypothetical protein
LSLKKFYYANFYYAFAYLRIAIYAAANNHCN